ncbi:unnamed protein product [Nyctereutes procyonoides]|uniref:(raccoon dog) hypothetical protein n=1 Tax=Nyctereutes procyonoides TaxID=34880 RepID=A0A811YZG8_NYCPR|nr:unnamed protein product [Nyctereutes procyonoides]
MGPGLLHCVAFCLLGAGHMGAMVIQSPRYQVTKVGKPVTLNCSQNLNHDAMYWYQQKLRQAPKLLLYYYDTELTKETDTSDNFQPSRLSNSLCSLSIRSPGLGDSAVYLCASSKDTELHFFMEYFHSYETILLNLKIMNLVDQRLFFYLLP